MNAVQLQYMLPLIFGIQALFLILLQFGGLEKWIKRIILIWPLGILAGFFTLTHYFDSIDLPFYPLREKIIFILGSFLVIENLLFSKKSSKDLATIFFKNTVFLFHVVFLFTSNFLLFFLALESSSLLQTYSHWSQKEEKNCYSFFNIFFNNLVFSTFFGLGVILFFGGTGSLNIFDFSVQNQIFYWISIIFLLISFLKKMGMIPFTFNFDVKSEKIESHLFLTTFLLIQKLISLNL